MCLACVCVYVQWTLAKLYHKAGRLDKAEALYKSTLRQAVLLQGPEHVMVEGLLKDLYEVLVENVGVVSHAGFLLEHVAAKHGPGVRKVARTLSEDTKSVQSP